MPEPMPATQPASVAPPSGPAGGQQPAMQSQGTLLPSASHAPASYGTGHPASQPAGQGAYQGSVSPLPPEGLRNIAPPSGPAAGQQPGHQSGQAPAAPHGTPQPGSMQPGQGQQPGAPSGQDAGQPGQAQPGQVAQDSQQRQGIPSLLPGEEADNMPIRDWSAVDLELGDADVNGQMVESFGKIAIEKGLTPSQAKALAQWHVQEVTQTLLANLKAEEAALQKAWGTNARAYQKEVSQLCDRLGRVPGLENFRNEFERCGASANATMMKMMHLFCSMLKEDSQGRISGSGVHVETAEEGIRAAFARARGF